MSEPFLGEIRIFAGNFAPRGFANCDGQLLAISSNTALFSLLGTFYGGDGRTTFGLPDLRGRVPVHVGSGPALPSYSEGQKGGSNTTTLTAANLPPHNHQVVPPVTNDRRTTNRPAGAVPAQGGSYSTASPSDVGAAYGTQTVGGGQSFSIMPPYLAVRFIIALVGIYPSRN